jgi:hypothetical protein
MANLASGKYLTNSKSKIYLNLLLLVVLVIIVSLITVLYISQERYFYFWDFSNYSSQTSDLVVAFKSSISEGIKLFRDSLPSDYNKIPCLPLVPFLLILGDSRLTFILSCALVYIVPFCLTMGAIATQLIPFNRFSVFWSTAFLTLFIQQTWASIFRGYPDLGAAVLMGLAVFVYLKDMRLRIWWQTPLIGFLLGLAILFRRHFAYSVRAFFLLIIIQGLIVIFWENRPLNLESKKLSNLKFHSYFVSPRFKQCLRDLTRYGVMIILVGISVIITMMIISPEFTVKIASINYRNLYSSYESEGIKILLYFGVIYGWLTLFLSFIGYLSGLISGLVIRANTYFVLLFGCVSVIQWSFLAKQEAHTHHNTHFTMFVVLGIAILVWVIKSQDKTIFRYLTLTLVMLFLTFNLLVGLTPVASFDNLASWGISEKNYHLYRPLFTISHPPFIRKDYQEFSKLIQYLREITPNQEPIYIAASSVTLNQSLIIEAENQLYGKEKRKLKVIYSPDIDSRDWYPLRDFSQAEYVIVATPFQHHLRPEEQKVVKVMVDVFEENWQLSRDFEIMPQSFNLENKVEVNIYKRIRPTSVPTMIKTLNLIQQRIQPKPGREANWAVNTANIYFDSFIGKQPINIYGSVGEKPESLLYYGKILAPVNLKAELTQVTCSGFEGTSVQLRAFSSDGQMIKETENLLLSPNELVDLSLPLQGKNASYVSLNFMSHDEDTKIEQPNRACYLRLDNLTLN